MKIRVGTRKSKLARVQTDIVSALLKERFPELEIEAVLLDTLGDRIPLSQRAQAEGKAMFTEEIEDLLLKGEIDVAVHSMKDLPNELNDRLVVGATPLRADPRDALVPREPGLAFKDLPAGSVIGTSSVRRKAQLLAMRKDLSVVDLHGNVDTRLARMEQSRYDGIVIAAAGLERLGESGRISQFFSFEQMVPAPCQGAIAVEARGDDRETVDMLALVDDAEVRAQTTCERAFARAIGGDCDVPAGAVATLDGTRLTLTGVILSPDGRNAYRGSETSRREEAVSVGDRLARRLLENGGSDVIRGAAR